MCKLDEPEYGQDLRDQLAAANKAAAERSVTVNPICIDPGCLCRVQEWIGRD